jgi:hypothetical protein
MRRGNPSAMLGDARAPSPIAGKGCHYPARPWHDRPASRRMGSRADPLSGALAGHCHDRNRSFDPSPCLTALVWTESQRR